MKLKYYLRGAGIGVIVTTLILMIAFHVNGGGKEEATVPETEQSLTIAEALSEKEANEEPGAAETEETGESEAAPVETETETAEETVIPETETADLSSETDTIEEEADQGQETMPASEEVRIVEFRIYAGQSPGAVSKSLLDAGIIDDEDAFYRYLVDNGLNDMLEVGTFSVPEGAEYSEIAKILTTNEYERKQAQ